jgi:sarcosine oxidase
MFDVIVLGLGGMGSAAAYHLASRGKRVLGLERFGPAHHFGSSHGDSRIIRQAYHEHPSYVPLAQRAYQLWEKLERDSGNTILCQTGGLMIGPPGSSVVEGAIMSAERYGLPYQVLNASELQQRFPLLRPRANETAMYEACAGYLLPELAIQSHLQLAERNGADLHFHEPVSEWRAHTSRDGVTVKTSRGEYEAAQLVIAPGAWAPDLLSNLEIPFQILRHVMIWLEPLAGESGFQPDKFPIYIWDVNGRDCFYGFPATATAAEGVKVAMHSGGLPCSADTIDRQISDADVSEVRHHIQRFIPSLNGKCLRASACMYTMSPDQHFVLGVHPHHPQVLIAAGFSGHGFKFTCVIGEIIAELATDPPTTQPIEFFSPARFLCRS